MLADFESKRHMSKKDIHRLSLYSLLWNREVLAEMPARDLYRIVLFFSINKGISNIFLSEGVFFNDENYRIR